MESVRSHPVSSHFSERVFVLLPMRANIHRWANSTPAAAAGLLAWRKKRGKQQQKRVRVDVWLFYLTVTKIQIIGLTWKISKISPAWTSSSFAVDYISNRQKELLCAGCWDWCDMLSGQHNEKRARNFVMIFFLLPFLTSPSPPRSPVEFHFYNMQSSYSSKIYFSDLLNEIKATYWWFLDVFYCIINNNISDFCAVCEWLN